MTEEKGEGKFFHLLNEMATRADKRRAPEPKVLVVDPRADGLAHTTRGLREAGFQVVALTRYEAAIPLFGVFQPDAVLIAAMAPDFEGCLAAKRLAQLARRAVPLFYLVDAPDPQLIAHCLGQGHGVDVLSRPIEISTLAAKLRAQISLVGAVSKVALRQGEAPGSEALHDVGTGLHNRRFLLAMITQDLRRTERFGGSFTVAVATLRGFDALSRDSGLELAEKMVRYCAMALTQSVREADLVARIGENSFGLLLPGTPEEAVPTLLERLKARFALARYQVNGAWVKLDLALGTASFPDVVATAPQMLAIAEEKARLGSKEAASRLSR